jgi:hypothetical protein
LGLKVLFEVLFYCFILLIATYFGILPKKDCGPFFLMLSIIFFAKAHYELVMNQERQNRTVCYLYNADTDKAS